MERKKRSCTFTPAWTFRGLFLLPLVRFKKKKRKRKQPSGTVGYRQLQLHRATAATG